MGKKYYTLERILDKSKHNGKVIYLAKWKNFSVKQSTWEPVENLKNAIEKIKEFEKEKCFLKNKRITKRLMYFS